MLKLYESVPGSNVLSLRIGGPIATIGIPIINPNNLHIEAWHVQDNQNHKPLILVVSDIRDVMPQGFVVDDHEVLSEASDLVRLHELIDMNFELLKLKVVSANGTSYGKVTDFAFETQTFYIQKLYTAQPVVKNLSGGTLSIDRTQIIEITNKHIVIEDPTVKAKVQLVSPAPSQG
jgi:uncharacterized protein YrrD